MKTRLRTVALLVLVLSTVAWAEYPDEWRVYGPPSSLPSSMTKTTVLDLEGNAADGTPRDIGWMFLVSGTTMHDYAYYTATPEDKVTSWLGTDWEWDDITFEPSVDTGGAGMWTVSPPGFAPYFANHYDRVMNYNYTSPNDYYMDSPHAVTVTQ